jgi:Ketopantoate reductase PanE/ApbA
MSERPIGVAGAGSIGCFVGGMYAAAGRRVALLGRPRVIGEIEADGLRLTSFEGFEKQLAPGQLTLSEDPAILGDAGAGAVHTITVIPVIQPASCRPGPADPRERKDSCRFEQIERRGSGIPTPRGCREILLSPAGLRRSSSMRRRDRG